MTSRRRKQRGAPEGGRFASERHPEPPFNLDVPDTETDLPERLRAYLPVPTANKWVLVAPILPPSSYLAGGTGLAAHLLHRISRDLDFMVEGDEDISSVREDLARLGRLDVMYSDADTLNCVLDETKLQLLRVSGQELLRPTTTIAGVRVASVEDITAMKLKVVMDRGELRDYFDLMRIDQHTPVSLEDGLAFFLRRYRPRDADQTIASLLRSLGCLDDVSDDPGLPVDRRTITSFWRWRHRELLSRVNRY